MYYKLWFRSDNGDRYIIRRIHKCSPQKTRSIYLLSQPVLIGRFFPQNTGTADRMPGYDRSAVQLDPRQGPGRFIGAQHDALHSGQ